MSNRTRNRRTKNEINMVPFIDVMLVLLIIFMVTAPMLSPSTINLPSVGQADRQPERFVQVLIENDNSLKIKDSQTGSTAKVVMGLDEMVAQVRLAQPEGMATQPPPVIIGADKNVKYETVVRVMDHLQRAGIQRVGLSVKQNP